MRRIALLALLLCFVPSLGAADEEPETITLQGEVVDIGCYAAREAKGPDHQACAARCLTNGNPAGLLDEQGHVYTIAAAAPAFTSFAAQLVRITGSLRGSLLRPTEMSIWVEEEWQPVALNAYGAPEMEATAPHGQ